MSEIDATPAVGSEIHVKPEGAITRWLSSTSQGWFTGYAALAAFATYSCMYAFRKGFAAGTFDGETVVPLVGAVQTKIVLLIAQVFGYCLSKFLGIKVVSEMTPARRARAIVLAIAVAEIALLLFAVVPAPYNAFCMFLNGLPLGMVWGLVFGFLEGRRVSDVLGAALCASFIVASGFVKTVGRWVLSWQTVNETWMPVVVGALFLLPMAAFVWMLAQLPPPTPEDVALRAKRVPMDGKARMRFFKAVAPGLVLLTAAYILLTVYRDFRDNFAPELWSALGYDKTPSIMTTSEIPVAVGALFAVGLCMVIRDNRRALLVIHLLLVAGVAAIGISTVLFQQGVIGPVAWMIAIGLGLYMGYVPYNCVLFDRLIPAVGFIGTAGFLIYVADAFGYLGSVVVMLYKNFGAASIEWLPFFTRFGWLATTLGTACFLLSALYFWRRAPTSEQS